MNAARILLAAVCLLCGNVAKAQDAASPSAWKVEEKVDKLDSSRSIILYVPSSDTLTIRGRPTSPAILAFRCGSYPKADIAIQWPMYLGYRWASVRWRIDAEPIVAEQWPVDRANGSLLTNAQGNKYARQFFGRKELVFSAIEGQTLSFPISGLEAAIKSIRELCSW